MKFWEAMKALEEGKLVKRSDWEYPISLQEAIISIYGKDLIRDWSVYEENQFFDFEDVVKGLCQGKKYKRMRWNSSVFLGPNGQIAIDGDEDIHWTIGDFLSNDWIEVK